MKLSYGHKDTMEEVRKHIQECEGQHTQQVAYSSFHDCLTQICWGCKKVRSNYLPLVSSLLLSERQEIVKSLEGFKHTSKSCDCDGMCCQHNKTLSEAISIITKGEGK